jgi:Icc-related predicted phosphoesterase
VKALLHISDTHGGLFPLDASGDVIVHSGDILPNRTRGIRPIEEAYQHACIERDADRLRAWIGGRKLLLVPGNHDFIDVAAALRGIGIDATEIGEEPLDVDGVRFLGFKWVPWFTGEWNNEISEREMAERLRPIEGWLDTGTIDVLVTHSPMYGVRDRNAAGERCGSRALRDVLQRARHLPSFLLHGHIHEASGYQGWSRGMVVSNAAGSQCLVKLEAEAP